MPTSEQMLDEVAAKLGRVPEPLRVIAEQSPDAMAGMLALRDAVFGSKDVPAKLDRRTRELLLTVLDIVAGNLEGGKNHARAAMAAGASLDEVTEAGLLTLWVFGLSSWAGTGHKVVDHAAEFSRSLEK